MYRLFINSVRKSTAVLATLSLALGSFALNATTIAHAAPPATVTVTIDKFIDGQKATAATAQSLSFPMTAAWSATSTGSGTGTFTLGPTGFNSATPYQAVTAQMTSGASYSTSETTAGNQVVSTSCTSSTTPYALVGYTEGDTYAAAAAGTPSATPPNFTNLTQNKYVIVWNESCQGSSGTIGGTVTGTQGVLTVTSIDAVDTTATADGTFTNGWKYVFNITVPNDETNLAMKFADWTNNSASGTIPVAGNMRISSSQADNGGATVLLTAADTYSSPPLHITGDLNPTLLGKQVQVTVDVAVPVGTPSGSYTTTYHVRTLNDGSSGGSGTTTAPVITTQPFNQTVSAGNTALFTVCATGTAPLSYQWYKNGTLIAGATSDSYTTPATVAGDNGSTFFAVVTNASGTATSSTATLTVTTGGGGGGTNPQPNPMTFSPTSGPTGTLVTITGTGFTNANAVWFGDAHDATFTVASDTEITATVPLDATTGKIAVLNPSNSGFTPDVFTVTTGPNTAPTFTTQPSNATATVGNTATFNVVATGTPALSYQWFKNGSAIGAATSASYTTPATVMGDNGATFFAVVTNASGTATSSTATLTVTAASTDPQPNPMTFTPTSGPTGTLVTITGTGFTNANAVWFGAAHDATFTVASDTEITATVPADATTGQIAVLNPTNAGFTPDSFTVTTSASTSPVIDTQPANTSVTAGNTATFTVAASGATPLSYQWYKNGIILAGATSASYTTTPTLLADNGSTFNVVVTNSIGTATSSSATLIVTAASTDPQPNPMTFTPTSGPAGTIVVITGDGFTNANEVWFGSAHDATFTVVSDTEIDATVPADATTGQIAVLNPTNAGFTQDSFTVTP